MEPFDLRDWPGFIAAGGSQNRPAIISHVATHSAAVRSTETLFVALPGAHTDGHRFIEEAVRRGARYVLAAHTFEGAVCGNILRVENPLRALQQIAAYYRRQRSTTVLAITGSYGKTMTKDLLATLLREEKRVICSPESFNSQLGVALSVLAISDQDQIALIEAGISQPGEMDWLVTMIQPDHALLTTIGEAHLSSFANHSTIAAEKGKLLAAVPSQGWALAPAACMPAGGYEAQSFATDDPTESLPHATLQPGYPATYVLEFPDGLTLRTQVQRPFPHLTATLNRALKVAWLLEVSPASIATSLKSYLPELMRTEVWTSPLGVTFVNDCYCADPLSVEGAVRLLQEASEEKRKVFVFGGLTKTTVDTQRLNHALAHAKLDTLLLMDEAANSSLELPQAEVYPRRKGAIRRLRAEQQSDRIILIKGPRRETLDNLRTNLAEGIGDSRLMIQMDAIYHNLQVLKRHLGNQAEVMPMLKADAYGLGSLHIGRFLSQCGCTIFGVAHVSEAVRLRLEGLSKALFVFTAAPYEASLVVEWDLQVGVDNLEAIHALSMEATRCHREVKLHLHIDTGMTRFGCRPEEATTLALAIAKAPFLTLHGIFSHFACADNPRQDRFSHKQLRCFTKTIDILEAAGHRFVYKHIANSYGALRFQIPYCNLVRSGLALAGLPATGKECQLHPALSLVSRLATVQRCQKGDTVSYGRSWRAKQEDSLIGVVPMGHFDGIRQSFSKKGVVLIHGERVPIVGTVCMDFFMVDLTKVPTARPDDPVVIFGEDELGNSLSAAECAANAGLSLYELITGLGPRIQRLYSYDGEARNFLSLA